MKLIELSIEGFRCFKNKTVIPFHSLTVFIGENDSGKSTMLKSIGLLLDKKEASENDYFSENGIPINSFTIEGVFSLNGSEFGNEQRKFSINNTFTIKKTYTNGLAFKTEIKCNNLTNNDLASYNTLAAEPTKQLLIRLNLPAQAHQEQRKAAIQEYINREWDSLPKSPNYVELKFADFSQLLPYFQYFSSNEYGNPQNLIKKTLDTIYSNHFYDENGNLKLKSFDQLQKKIKANIDKKIEDNLLAKIKLYNPKIKNVKGNIDIDFAQGLSFGGIELDEGQGYRLVNEKGDGSKKRLFLSILEWDKEEQTKLTNTRSILRGYDEPDANLHFDAQRKMFYAISEVSNNSKSNTQNIIATHSVAMIDRAPSKSINHVIQNNGISKVEYLNAYGDEDIKKFLNQVSEIGGINNSSIFYEKCFLLVEGESEDIAIKKIYRKLFNKSITEDGIVLINLQSNGAWFNFLKLMNRNKEACTVMLLDTDTQNPECGANVTVDKLNEIGFSPAFMANNVFFAGNQEFEDTLPDNKIRDILNRLYPRPTKGKWSIAHVQRMRTTYPKLSKGFDKETLKFIRHHKKRYAKPEFASEIVDVMTVKEIKNITVLINLFSKIHQIIA